MTGRGETRREGSLSAWSDLEREVVKLTPRVHQRFQGVSHGEVQNDQRRKNLIADLINHVMNHPEKEQLRKELFINNNEAYKL